MPTPKFLTVEEVLVLHADQVASFGGSAGVRDQGLLESPLSQPQATFGGQLLHPTLHEQAAAYLFYLAMNHPFIDGNKRTAFAAMDAFLRLNGSTLDLSNEEAYQLVLQVAEGSFTKPEITDHLSQPLTKLAP